MYLKFLYFIEIPMSYFLRYFCPAKERGFRFWLLKESEKILRNRYWFHAEKAVKVKVELRSVEMARSFYRPQKFSKALC